MTTAPEHGAGQPVESLEDAVRLTYDAEADVAYLALGSDAEAGDVSRTVPVDVGDEPGIDVTLDLDANGRLVGVEVLGASTRLAPDVMASARRLGE